MIKCFMQLKYKRETTEQEQKLKGISVRKSRKSQMYVKNDHIH